MPVKSEKQRRFMYASLAGKTDVPPSVAKKFVGPKAHNDGGAVKEPGMKKPPMSAAKKAHGKAEIAFMKKAGAPKKMLAEEKAEYGMRKGGTPKKMMRGGSCK
jgi:hypothetical protein